MIYGSTKRNNKFSSDPQTWYIIEISRQLSAFLIQAICPVPQVSCTYGSLWSSSSPWIHCSLGSYAFEQLCRGKKGPGGGTKRLVCVTMVPPGWQRSVLLLTPPPPPLTVLHITVLSDRKVSSQLKIPCFFRSYSDSGKLISIANQSLNKKICK